MVGPAMASRGSRKQSFAKFGGRVDFCSGLKKALAIFLIGIAPQAATAQMSLPGKSGVSSSGAATYSVPIAVPPGTAGMTPSLSLDYDSQGSGSGGGLGGSIAGVNWSLGGLPSIARCPRTMAQDGVRGAVNYDANDRYCLDGQRLMAVSGVHGADGTVYATEIESFSRIVSRGTAGSGPAWFEVRTKSGQTLQFGNTTDSRVLAQGKTSARSWGVNKVSDTKGNYFTVTYNTSDAAANGQVYPSRIDYTANDASSLVAYNSVRFVYETGRPDIAPVYQAGSLTKTTLRLAKVQTYAGANLVGEYRLAYEQGSATGRSRLTGVTLCDGASNCLPASTFTWQDSSFAFSSSFHATGNGFNTSVNAAGGGFGGGYLGDRYSGVPNGPGLIALDLNGDGKTDFLQQVNNGGTLFFITYLSNGNGTFSGQYFTSNNGFDSMQNGRGPGLLAIDFDGDGKTDIVQQWKDGQGYLRFILYRSVGNGTFSASLAPSNNIGFETAGNTTNAGTGLLPVDLNGDGRTDLLQQYINGNGQLAFFTYLSNGDGTFTSAYQNPQMLGFNSTIYGPGLIPVDLNGDGKTDLIQQYNYQGTLYLIPYMSNGDGSFTWVAAQTANTGFGSATGTAPNLIPLDVNGDGKTDLIQQWNINGTLYLSTFISKGDGTFAYVPAATTNNGYNSTTGGPGLIPVDLNGDGKTDLIQQWNNNGALYVLPHLSNGDGTFRQGTWQLSPSGIGFNSTGQGAPGLMPVDSYGIGKSGLVQLNKDSNGQLGFVLFTPSTAMPDLVTTITGGLGHTTSIISAPLTNASVYTKDSTAVYPVMDLQVPLRVVSRVDTADGIGGTYSSTYAYAGAKVDQRGRGFLGFRQVKATDLQTNIVQTTTYRQDFPYVGSAAAATAALGSVTLNQTANTYASTTSLDQGLTRYRVFQSQSQTSSSDLDGTALPTVTTTSQYDSYNNATQVSVTTSDGYGKTTNNTYTNDTTNWLLGRLTAATVTAQAPQQLGQYCSLPWGSTINAGQSITAYSAANPPVGQSCSTLAQTRSCTNGTLNGSYSSQSCSALCALPWGGTIAQGQSVTAYSATSAPAGQLCTSKAQTRTCGADGSLTGSFTNQSCSNTVITIASSSSNFNLWNYLVANGQSNGGAAGTWSVAVASGVVIGSTSTSTPAFDTGSFPSGSTLQLTNNGTIAGKGGPGGAGGIVTGSACASGSAGTAGGPAIQVRLATTLANNGAIWGGGGGGGGSNGFFRSGGGGGGGGGAGTAIGAGGVGGAAAFSPGFAGSAGTATAGGTGGFGGAPSSLNKGGDGGGPGSPGGAGTAISCSGGAGGAAGSAVIGNSFVTWSSIGDRRGPLN